MMDEIFLLTEDMQMLYVGGTAHKVGMIRSLCKASEINDLRVDEILAARDALGNKVAPAAVMLRDTKRFDLAEEISGGVLARMVLGWDAWRSMVTGFCWEFLPTLGYAVHDARSGRFTLHEERQGRLYLLSFDDAVQRGILSSDKMLVRRGQPEIDACHSVEWASRESYAVANCVLADGTTAVLSTYVERADLPDTSWFVGKLPVEIGRFRAI